MGTGQDVNDYKIKELEKQMDKDSFDGLNNPGIDNSRTLTKRSKKSYKSLR